MWGWCRHLFGAHNLGNSGAEMLAAVDTTERIAEQLDVRLLWRDDGGMKFLATPREKGW